MAYLAPFVPVADGDEVERWRRWEVNVLGGVVRTYWVTESTGALALTLGASAYQPIEIDCEMAHGVL